MEKLGTFHLAPALYSLEIWTYITLASTPFHIVKMMCCWCILLYCSPWQYSSFLLKQSNHHVTRSWIQIKQFSLTGSRCQHLVISSINDNPQLIHQSLFQHHFACSRDNLCCNPYACIMCFVGGTWGSIQCCNRGSIPPMCHRTAARLWCVEQQ